MAKKLTTEQAIFAGGCFWGLEYFFKPLAGVLSTKVGYTGGHKTFPTYEQVCAGNTGHFEAIKVEYDSDTINYEKLVRYFFEIHDPTQPDGQGPDIGEQYLSVIFFKDEHQKEVASFLIEELEELGYPIATQLLPASTFWEAEDYHQYYYQKTGKQPYCHRYIKKFK
jgi:peptide methionine sulfoxide reductase msrA/msrB